MKKNKFIKIGHRQIKINSKPFIVAEISGNHNGSFKNAKKLISIAKSCGADAVKLQTYEPQAITLKSNNSRFIIKSGIWKKNKLWDLYDQAKTPYNWQKKLFSYAKKKGIICFSTPFDSFSVQLLEKINCPLYKIASFELNDYPLLKSIARTRKTVILSTGLASIKEIENSVKYLKKNGSSKIIILYCVSSYPAPVDEFNIRNIHILRKKFGCVVGLSDHAMDNKVACVAYCYGARVFEKHIKISNQSKGSDVKFSLGPEDFKKYIKDLKEVSLITKKDFFFRSAKEKKNIIYRRSIYAIKDIKKNEKFTEKNLKCLRPGGGIEPFYFDKILNNRSLKNIKSGTLIKRNHFRINK